MPNEHVPAAEIGLPQDNNDKPPMDAVRLGAIWPAFVNEPTVYPRHINDRAQMEAAIEQLLGAAEGLIAMLDALDVPHDDLEDAQEDADVHGMCGTLVDCEPSLGSLEDRCFEQDGWAGGLTTDAELDDSDYEPDTDAEPEEHDSDGDEGDWSGIDEEIGSQGAGVEERAATDAAVRTLKAELRRLSAPRGDRDEVRIVAPGVAQFIG
jgi:hypothetical protein